MEQFCCRLAAIDMDGTLLRPDKTIHPDTIRDLQAAKDAGIEPVYCTGRGVPELKPYLPLLPMMRYAICNSGAVIYDLAEAKCLHSSAVRARYLPRILAEAARYGAMLHYLTGGESIVSAQDITHMADFHMGVYQPLFLSAARQVADMAAEASSCSAIISGRRKPRWRSPRRASARPAGCGRWRAFWAFPWNRRWALAILTTILRFCRLRAAPWPWATRSSTFSGCAIL